MSNSSTILLTGSTGFIGQYVLRGLLEANCRVVVLLRSGPRSLDASMNRLGVDVHAAIADGRLDIIEGALPDRLPPAVPMHIDQIVHSAACLQPEQDDSGEPFTTNVEGVKALVAWAEDHHVHQLHFVSTAYVCGREMETAPEHFHKPQPRFETDYELSKYQAEAWLLEWSSRPGRSLTIHRPSLVVGDSRTGYTTQYGGFYQLARMIDVLRQFFADRRRDGQIELPLRIPARPQDTQNFVCVDYVADVIVKIVTHPQWHGQIYHITNPHPPSNDEVKCWLEAYFNVAGGFFVEELDRTTSTSLAENMFLQLNELILQQMNYVPLFECDRVRKLSEEVGIRTPILDQRLAFKLLDYAVSQRWGRVAEAAAS